MLFLLLISLILSEKITHESINHVALEVEWSTHYEKSGQEFLKKMHTCYSIPSWSSWACGGHGSCTDQDHCICKAPFKGSNCSEVNLTHPVMSMFTIDLDPDTNRAPTLPHCNGIQIDELGACGEVKEDGIAHFGVCVLNNVCRCYCGWSGINCVEFDYQNYREEIDCFKPYPEHILREN